MPQIFHYHLSKTYWQQPLENSMWQNAVQLLPDDGYEKSQSFHGQKSIFLVQS